MKKPVLKKESKAGREKKKLSFITDSKAAKKIREIVDYRKRQKQENADVTQAADEMIRCENLVKIYKTDEIEVMALSGLDLTVKRGEMMSIEDVVEILAIDLIGAVPDDENIVISTNQGQPLVGDNSLAGRAYFNICKRILGEDVDFLDLSESGFFKKLSRFFKKNDR